MFEPLVTWQDWRDQVLHAVWGAFMTFVLWINVGLLFAAILTMLFAVFREVVYQHPGQCGAGCRTDLMGWLVGVLIVSGILL